MRTTAFLLLATLTTWSSVGCKKSEPTNTGGTGGAGSAAGIEGTYIITDFEMSGEKADEKDLSMFAGKNESDRIVIITGDTLTFKKGGKDDSQKYKLDATKTPAEIDLLIESGGGKEKTVYGIYKLDGDTLVIATAGATSKNDEKGKIQFSSPEAKDRLKEFKTRKDSFDMMLTMKKKK